jgi:hypothetical protein
MMAQGMARGARVAPGKQVLAAMAKSPGLAAPLAMLAMVRTAEPTLVRVSCWGVLVAGRLTEPKFRLADDCGTVQQPASGDRAFGCLDPASPDMAARRRGAQSCAPPLDFGRF